MGHTLREMMSNEERPESDHPADVPIERRLVREFPFPQRAEEGGSALSEPLERVSIRERSIDSAHVLDLFKQGGAVAGRSISFPASTNGSIATVEDREETEHALGFHLDVRNIAGMFVFEDLAGQLRQQVLSEFTQSSHAIDEFGRFGRRSVPYVAKQNRDRCAWRLLDRVGDGTDGIDICEGLDG